MIGNIQYNIICRHFARWQMKHHIEFPIIDIDHITRMWNKGLVYIKPGSWQTAELKDTKGTRFEVHVVMKEGCTVLPDLEDDDEGIYEEFKNLPPYSYTYIVQVSHKKNEREDPTLTIISNQHINPCATIDDGVCSAPTSAFMVEGKKYELVNRKELAAILYPTSLVSDGVESGFVMYVLGDYIRWDQKRKAYSLRINTAGGVAATCVSFKEIKYEGRPYYTRKEMGYTD